MPRRSRLYAELADGAFSCLGPQSNGEVTADNETRCNASHAHATIRAAIPTDADLERLYFLLMRELRPPPVSEAGAERAMKMFRR